MRSKSRKTLTGVILQTISEVGEATLDSFFPAKYPEARLWRELLGSPKQEFSPRTFSAILSRLRSQGLVEKRKARGRYIWRISTKGKSHLRHQEIDKPKSDGIKRLVIFDVPENMRAKRVAIRAGLIANGFKMLQKSVWLGTSPLADEFIEMLDGLELKPHVHIFAIRGSGTL